MEHTPLTTLWITIRSFNLIYTPLPTLPPPPSPSMRNASGVPSISVGILHSFTPLCNTALYPWFRHTLWHYICKPRNTHTHAYRIWTALAPASNIYALPEQLTAVHPTAGMYTVQYYTEVHWLNSEQFSTLLQRYDIAEQLYNLLH